MLNHIVVETPDGWNVVVSDGDMRVTIYATSEESAKRIATALNHGAYKMRLDEMGSIGRASAEWGHLSDAQVLAIAPAMGNFSQEEIEAFCAGFRRCARVAYEQKG